MNEFGGRTEEGYAHSFGSEAVVLLYVSGLPQQISDIEKAVPKLSEQLGMLALFTCMNDLEKVRTGSAIPMTLRVSSPDFAGLVAGMTEFLGQRDLPIIDHHTIRTTLPHASGARTYRHRFTVLLPPTFDRKSFLHEFDALSHELNFMYDNINLSDFY
ncbi:MAG: hypothetical protein ACPGXK_00580 [Phycisphaerae bacterium]